jgi:hypothetical protein
VKIIESDEDDYVMLGLLMAGCGYFSIRGASECLGYGSDVDLLSMCGAVDSHGL